MYKDIAYLDIKDWTVKSRRFEQDYIDFKMREHFTSFNDFIKSEFIDFKLIPGRENVHLVGVYRPYVFLSVTKLKILQKFLESVEHYDSLITINEDILKSKGFLYTQALEIQRIAEYTLYRTLVDLRKYKITHINYHGNTKYREPKYILECVNNYLKNYDKINK